jgi:hypothetical protein
MGLLAYLCTLGFDVAFLRFVPTYQTQRAWGLLRGVIEYIEKRVIVVSFLVAFIGISTTLVRGSELSPALKHTFLVGFNLVPIWALLFIRCSVVRAYGGVSFALVPERLVREGLLLGLVALGGWGFQWNIDALLVMLATIAASAAALGLASLAMCRLRPRAVAHALPVYDPLTWHSTALPLLVAGATEALLNRTGVLVLGWFGVFTVWFSISLFW